MHSYYNIIHYLILLVLLFPNNVFPSPASSSDTQYYRIISANKEYSNKCLQDNTSNSSYTYLVNDFDFDNNKQKFELIADKTDSCKFYLRNLYSRKYIQNNCKPYGEFNFPQGIASKYSITPYTITPIGEDQVLIYYTENNGITRYLNAADNTSIKEKVFIEDALYSRYAWYIVNANQDITHISPKITHENISIAIVNRHIIITGCKDYTIYNSAGESQPPIGERSPGIYIIKTPKKTFKVLVN